MNKNPNGPTGILYFAICVLVVAVAVLAYFVLSPHASTDNKSGEIGIDAPFSPALRPASDRH